MKSNIYEIAQRAGVSTATVSRVLNNKGPVARGTRERVIRVMEELNYHPSSMARGLAASKAPVVGLLTIDLETPHYACTVNKMSRGLSKIGYSAILCNTGGNTESNLKHLQMLIGLGCSGILCVGSVFRDTLLNSHILAEFSEIPFIQINCAISAPNSYAVVFDEDAALHLCIEHLHALGRRKVAYVKDADTYSGRRKCNAFVACCQEYGLKGSGMTADASRGLEGGVEAARELLEREPALDALICGDDSTAIGAMKYIQSTGRRIPEDVAVVGFNNSLLSRYCTPTLTSVNTKIDSASDLMIHIFSQIMDHEEPPHLLSVAPELVIRGSTVPEKGPAG